MVFTMESINYSDSESKNSDDEVAIWISIYLNSNGEIWTLYINLLNNLILHIL